MKVNEVTRVLKHEKCFVLRHGANHDIWYSPITNDVCPVSRHGTEELKAKTLATIYKRLLGRKPE